MINYKHSVSELLVAATNRFERGDITKEGLLGIVSSLEAVSVDDNQTQFFQAFRRLVDKVEATVSKHKKTVD